MPFIQIFHCLDQFYIRCTVTDVYKQLFTDSISRFSISVRVPDIYLIFLQRFSIKPGLEASESGILDRNHVGGVRIPISRFDGHPCFVPLLGNDDFRRRHHGGVERSPGANRR